MEDESQGQGEAFPSEADVDQILGEFDGDHRAAIKALLHDVACLASDYGLSVSRGFIRRAPELKIALK